MDKGIPIFKIAKLYKNVPGITILTMRTILSYSGGDKGTLKVGRSRSLSDRDIRQIGRAKKYLWENKSSIFTAIQYR